MKRRGYILYLLLSLGIISSCAVEKEEGDKIINFSANIAENKNFKDTLCLSEFIDSVGFIALETTPDNLIGETSKIFFSANNIIIADRKSKQIFIFDDKGKYINKISRQGRGPGEYLILSHIMLDQNRSTVMVFDRMQKKVLYYGLDGGFEREIANFSENAIIRDMINLPDGRFLCYTYDFIPEDVGDKVAGLWIAGANGEIVKTIFNYTEKYPVVFNFMNSYLEQQSDGRIILRDAINSNLFVFNNDSITPYITYLISGSNSENLKGVSESKTGYARCNMVQTKGDYSLSRWVGLIMRKNNFIRFSKITMSLL